MITIIVIIVLAGIILFFIFQKKKATNLAQPTSNIQSNTIQSRKYNLSIFDNDKGFTQLTGIRHHKTSNKLDFSLNEQVYLVPEPDNIFDRNAVKVITNKGIKIGYISKFNNTEILDLIEKGYYFIVKVSSINLDEPDYPFAMLKITRTKDPDLIPLTKEEILEFNNESIEVVEKYKQDSKNSYELTKRGLELEKGNNITEAIKCFEEVILLPHTPPIAFKRLFVYYRKIKDYSNEIRVLNKNIESVLNSKALDYLKKDEIKEIKNRIKKAEALKNKKANT